VTKKYHESGDIVLVVEDETLVRLVANDMLTDAGYRVLEARDGQEALAILEVHENIRVLFTDIRMPNIDGLKLAEIAGERWPDIGVVITSGDTAAPKGATFLAKPYTSETALTAIKNAMKHPKIEADASDPCNGDVGS
jgi:DNA-binding NtrC family response regulator